MSAQCRVGCLTSRLATVRWIVVTLQLVPHVLQKGPEPAPALASVLGLVALRHDQMVLDDDGILGLGHRPGTTVRLGLGAGHLDVDFVELFTAFLCLIIEAAPLDRWVRGLVRGLNDLGSAVARAVQARVGDGTLGLDHDPGTTVRLGLGRQRAAVHLDVDRIEPLLAFFEFKIEAPRGAGFSDRVEAGAEDGDLWDGGRHHCSGGTNMSLSRVQTRCR
eukprot:scaffold74347_cov60-Phaeocystis_antarctica.AAC.2